MLNSAYVLGLTVLSQMLIFASQAVLFITKLIKIPERVYTPLSILNMHIRDLIFCYIVEGS